MTSGKKFRAALFDLDGVLVDTAKYHYQAWKRLADELGFVFTEQDNERLKGVSRMRSLEILLEVGGVAASEEKKLEMAEKKNAWYVELISNLDDSALLPGSRELLTKLHEMHVPCALGSASKNAQTVIDGLKIASLFTYVVDARKIEHAKPAPDVFLAGAKGMGVDPSVSVVFEDAPAGVEAAHAAGMYAVGIGTRAALPEADVIAQDLAHVDAATLFFAA